MPVQVVEQQHSTRPSTDPHATDPHATGSTAADRRRFAGTTVELALGVSIGASVVLAAVGVAAAIPAAVVIGVVIGVAAAFIIASRA
ncbi:hypothetical protein GA0111570_103265 [Raineyella antarctica]|uniref:Uncharacterized protein n=1 Tax=Raineyella antarctica TaxID=1577474 RepID=A0A1G6GHX8_9ACTN|nr:hypothetical protein [Raineyella antarctica]SDB81355.1 hypothetical protein GA0111570_103265 [Raineyella antarctica]